MPIEDGENRTTLYVGEEFPGAISVELEPSRHYCWLMDQTVSDTSPLPRVQVLTIGVVRGQISIFPVYTFPQAGRFLQPRYKPLTEICLEIDMRDELPSDDASVRQFLIDHIPPGLIQDPDFGLGVQQEMLPMVDIVKRIQGITSLVISRSKATHIDENVFYLSEDDFFKLRSDSRSIIRQYQKESRDDRQILAYNALLNKVDPVRYPQKERPYRAGTVHKLLGGTRGTGGRMAPRDRKTVISALQDSAKNLNTSDIGQLFQLHRAVEVMNLDRLIEAFAEKIDQSRPEKEWHSLLALNPFLLSMAFGYPIYIVQSQASVGGMSVTGGGTKIADFLAATSTTHNAALVEIKTPQTDLLKGEYRSGVYLPSKSLMGAVVQVLDQRRQLVSDIAGLKHRSRIQNIETDAVDCVIIAGRTPINREMQSSLELLRHQFKDVMIITFDELLEKLKILREMLAGPATALEDAPALPADDHFFDVDLDDDEL